MDDRRGQSRTGLDPFGSVVAMLPPPFRSILAAASPEMGARAEEIRVRLGRPLGLVLDGEDVFLDGRGRPTLVPDDAFCPDGEAVHALLGVLTQWSIYAMEDELRQGFVTVRGGHRIGLVGRAVVEDGHVRSLRGLWGLNIRVSREVMGAGWAVLPHLLVGARPVSTLVVAPPQAGKTTLLRDLARLLSVGAVELQMRGRKVGIVDERSELAAVIDGVPTHDVGPRTDVLDACPKADGMMMMVRSMSPEVLVTDEIGHARDTEAIEEAVRSGVVVLASAHGFGLADIARRAATRELIARGVFERTVVLGRSLGPGTVEQVFDARGQSCLPRPLRGGGGR